MKETLKYGIILGIICFLASSILAIVNSVAQPRIQLQKEKEENVALKEVFPDTDNFKPVTENGKTIYYIAYNDRNVLKGFIIKCEKKGYSSVIETLVGLKPNLDIINIKVLSQNETPGLGNKISEDSFQRQFKGKNLSAFNQIQAISGATISSSAVIASIKEKISELKDKLLMEAKVAK